MTPALRLAAGCAFVAAGCFALLETTSAQAPARSFHRLVTGNGHSVASFDRRTNRVDTWLEHPYRFEGPRERPADLCFPADETRDLLHDAYFGVRLDGAGTWVADGPPDDVRYEPGTNVVVAERYVGADRALRTSTYVFAPFGYDGAALVFVLELDNVSDDTLRVAPYALVNARLGDARGGREPSAEAEQVSWDAARGVFYEYSDASRGTLAIVPLTAPLHRTVSTGSSGAFERLARGESLDDSMATAGPTADVAPGLEWAEVSLAPRAQTSVAFALVFAHDDSAGPKVDALRTSLGAVADPKQLVEAEIAAFDAWRGEPPASLPDDEHDLYAQSLAILRMAQVREPGRGHGQILASLPPGAGSVDAQWNISWVRDMAYATAALARAGHLDEARDALRFQLEAGPGLHVDAVGRPYRISITRYFGNGDEESDCNADGPNIEFDGFGLFLFSLGEYVRAGGDLSWLDEARYAVLRDEIADVLVSLVAGNGLIAADSSIWEVHWNGRQRQFAYTSIAAARGLCDAAFVARALGHDADAGRYEAAGAALREAIAGSLTDARGALAQSVEDLAAGAGYVDAAAVEAVTMGLLSPTGRVARATVDAMLDRLTVPTGVGIMRNDDGGWYDSQEWVFVDFRALAPLRAAGASSRADAIRTWLVQHARANDLHFSELHDRDTGAYLGSIPMVGFGAGAYLLEVHGPLLEAACGSYAAEPPVGEGDGGVIGDAGPLDAGPDDAGPVLPGPVDAGSADAGLADAGVADAATVDAQTRDAALCRSGIPGGCVEDDGCTCSVPGARRGSLGSGLGVALGVAWLLVVRRRRRR